MARASHAETAQRLNLARHLLRRSDSFAQAVHKLAGSCAISPRQAYRYYYRYLHHAERLKAPVPVVTAKIPFTVKLPENLVKRLRRYVKRSRSTLSEVVSQAVSAWFDRGRWRG
jgi:Ribbon-helix-helix protein, copG family